MAIDELKKKACELAGRPVEVDKTTDGKYIALWMNFASPPPPKAETKEAALEGFIDMMLQRSSGEATIDPG